MKSIFKIIATVVSFVLSSNSYGQVVADDYARSLSASTGKPYINVPGTRLFFVREKNMFFKKMVNKMVELDAKNEEAANVFFYELPFNKAVVSENEGVLIATDKIQVNGYAGTLETYTNGNVRVLALSFGDADFKILVNIRMPLANKELEKKYIAFCKTLIYKKDVAIDCASLSYLARFNADMAWFGYQSAGVVYGKYAFLPSCTAAGDRKSPRIYITEHLTGSVDSVRFVDLFDIPDGVNISVLEKNDVKEDTVDGFKRYKLVAWVGKAPNKMLVYQTAKTNGNLTLVFTATATSNYEENLNNFKAIGESLQLKEAAIVQ